MLLWAVLELPMLALLPALPKEPVELAAMGAPAKVVPCGLLENEKPLDAPRSSGVVLAEVGDTPTAVNEKGAVVVEVDGDRPTGAGAKLNVGVLPPLPPANANPADVVVGTCPVCGTPKVLLENEKPPFPPPLEKGLVLLAVVVLVE